MSYPHTIDQVPEHSILGLSYSGMHDSAIAIISPQGLPIFAQSLERTSRIKQDGRFPQALLDMVPWDKIDSIALSVEGGYQSAHDKQSLFHPDSLEVVAPVDRAHDDIFAEQLGCFNKPIHFVPHHLSHAASAFWMSDFAESLCLVYDGGMANEEWFGGLYHASRENGIQASDLFGAQRYANVTHVYTAVTAILGFTPLKHEGKITGLAAYGKKNPHCDAVLQKWLYQPRLLDDLFHWENRYSETGVPKMKASLAKIAQLKEDLVDVSREDLAFAVQSLAEQQVLEILRAWQKSGHQFGNICLSGGLFANVKINQRVSELGFDKLFVSPPMSDDGTALGAALEVASKQPSFAPQRMTHAYLGVVSDTDEIDALLAQKNVKTLALEPDTSPAKAVAELLNDGKIVAVYQGASEYGPRALGNRSILANADDPDINHTLNQRLHRTEFMPFAPMCLKDGASQYFQRVDHVEHAAEFMTVTLDCTDVMKAQCPAVVHCDGTARPQLVTEQANPFIFAVLNEYRVLSGKPAVVNTSFNVHEEPIICTAQDALKGFFESALDYLYIEGSIIALADNPHLEIAYLREKFTDYRHNQKAYRDTIARQEDEQRTQQNLIHQLEQQLHQAQSEKEEARNQLMQQQVQLAQIQDSTLWRITQPLRTLLSGALKKNR